MPKLANNKLVQYTIVSNLLIYILKFSNKIH